MSALRGTLVGVVGLSALYAAVSTEAAANRAGGLLSGAAGLFRRFVDPAVPLIPDRRTGTNVGAAAAQAAQLPPSLVPSSSYSIPPPAAPVPVMNA